MAPQLQINQGPQDALLFDNTRSYFTNVGYTRTSNFQMELRDIDPQNTANLGSTVNFVIPKAADLLGPLDLVCQFEKAKAAADDSTRPNVALGWVENIGFAMIEKITLSVGNHDIETLTGEHLNIMNELMRSDSHRYDRQVGKTGRPLVAYDYGSAELKRYKDNESGRIISHTDSSGVDTVEEGKKLIVPLGLFFTTHPSKYFPLAAIAGCNDVRVAIKFRQLNELIMCSVGNASNDGNTPPAYVAALDGSTAFADCGLQNLKFGGSGYAFKSGSCKLRCQYIHVTSPEATSLMNKEHVRLMRLWHGNEVTKLQKLQCSRDGTNNTISIDLAFLHPVQEMIITIRKVNEMGSKVANTEAVGAASGLEQSAQSTAMIKNYFAYQGGNKDPNMETWTNALTQAESGSSVAAKPTYFKTKTFKLTLNGQSRHLDGDGIDRDYLMNRIMPQIHSNATTQFSTLKDQTNNVTNAMDFQQLAELFDRKEIYVYPFALNPEGHNPSGSVNFSKVSHAKLDITVEGFSPSAGASGVNDEEIQVDVYGIYYNWLAIKDGRALTSFA